MRMQGNAASLGSIVVTVERSSMERSATLVIAAALYCNSIVLYDGCLINCRLRSIEWMIMLLALYCD